jgi:carbamoyl-phosphate synthase large subunit
LAIRQILSRERPDAILIGTDVELPYFAANREELETEFDLCVLVSSPEVVEVADDKWKTNQFLTENGFPHPLSSLSLHDEEFFDTVTYPLIIKPRRGARSVGVELVHTRTELETAFRKLDGPIIQECVGSPADEYTAGAIVFDGECEASIVMRRDLRDGNTYRAYVRPYDELNEAVQSIAETLSPTGPVNFQFRVRETHPVVFEINARFSGTTPLRAHAGFNEVELCLRRALWGERISQPEIKPMVLLRHWDETAVEWPGFEEMSRRAAIDLQRHETV